jgi:gamma-glutamyltranspeptidase / glutathione hydrolase
MSERFPKAEFLFLIFLFVLAAEALPETVPLSSIGTRGMVSTASPLATQAGLEILKKGGNAFDAAVAIAAALNVVEPMMSGIGGYGTILAYDARHGKVLFLNCSGRIPKAVDSDAFRALTPGYMANRSGAKAVSTPGNVHAWESMAKSYGRLPWKALFGPAVRLAETGFVLDSGPASIIKDSFDGFPAFAKTFYGKDGRPLQAGETLVQKELARSFRLISDRGAKIFYEGELGRAIAQEIRQQGGFLSLQDLRNDKAEWREPIHISYRGFEIYTASPPANSFCSLIRLGMMSHFDVAALGHNTEAMLHAFIEASKHAFWCRLKYSGDPDVNPPPLETLLSETYWKEQAGLIDPKKAKPFQYPGLEMSNSQHTTHFVVADAEGNIVSATQTLGGVFGSRIMPPGTGIWLNNSLSFCTFEPKGNPMDAHPGRKKLSGDCPTIVLKDEKPWAALGTPGGHTIGQTVPQMVMNLIDFKMGIAAALAASRVSFVEPDTIAVEEGVGEAVIKRLEALGHKIRVSRGRGGLGNAHGLTIVYGPAGKPASFQGAADPRGSGLAQGY